MSVSGKCPTIIQPNVVISPSKKDQNWPELNPPLSQLGVGAFSQRRLSPTPRRWNPPGCVLLACRVLSHLGRVRGELCLHPSISPSSSPPPAMPSSHPQRRRRRLVTVAISEKPKLALLAVHRWQRHFAFLLIRKQNKMIKCGVSGGRKWTYVFNEYKLVICYWNDEDIPLPLTFVDSIM